MSLAETGRTQVPRIGLQAEGVAVENRGLSGLGLDALGDDLRDGGRAVGGGQQQLGRAGEPREDLGRFSV
jgi:hypothetical protein